MTAIAAAISIRLPTQDETLLERAARHLGVSKSEFIRRSIAAYAAKVMPGGLSEAEIDARHIGQGGGLRAAQSVADPHKRAVLERLREKHGYAG
ncbi:MAG: ribbon-helix-helix protein, CopG family [Burkholderiaceae bacterium]|nr:ribbon-helix-helix protein, CopG family [Burkholderiaceae bacterium]